MSTDSRPPRPKPYELNKSTTSSSSSSIRVSQGVANGRDLPDAPTPLHPPGREANNGLGSSQSSTSPNVPPRPTDMSSSAVSPYRGYGTSSYPGGSSYNSPYSSYGSSYNSPYSSYGRYSSSPYGSSYSSYRTPYSSYGGGYGSSYGGYGSSYGGYGSSYGGGYGSSYGGGYGSSYGGGYGYNRFGQQPGQENPNGGVFNGALQTGYNQINKFGQVVESFSHFSRLLDANFDAVHGSFASVLRLMEVFGEFFFVIRSFALFRFFANTFARLSGSQGMLEDSRTRKDVMDVSDFLGGNKKRQRTIPFLLLLVAISVSTPILVVRLWNALRGRRSNPEKLEGAWSETAEKEKGMVPANAEQPGPFRGLARAIFDYQGESQRDLSFRKDETIRILDRPYEQWWLGETPDGRQGFFPSNFVELLKEAPIEQPPMPNQFRNGPPPF